MSFFKAVLVLFVLSLSSAQAAPVSLECRVAPGGYLCRQMSTMDSLMRTHCTGSPCDALFVQQANAFQSFVEYYNQNVFEQPAVEAEMGRKAYALASRICSYEWTGDATSFSATIFQGNLALDILRELQVGSGRTSPRHCQLFIR